MWVYIRTSLLWCLIGIEASSWFTLEPFSSPEHWVKNGTEVFYVMFIWIVDLPIYVYWFIYTVSSRHLTPCNAVTNL